MNFCKRSVFLLLGLLMFSVSSYANSMTFEKAKSLWADLSQWEKDGDWEKYYANKEEYEIRIVNFLDSVQKDSPDYYKAKYFSWKIANSFGKDSRTAFDSFIIAIRDIDYEDKMNVLLVESVIEELRKAEMARLKDRVSSIYKELLVQSGDSAKIKAQAKKFYKDGDVDSSVSLYRTYVASKSEEELGSSELYELIEDFAYNGVSELSDPAFAEELYEMITLRHGKQDLSEAHLYLRALNLEYLGFFDRALKVYLQLVNSYPESLMKDECNYRIASIFAYRKGEFDSAKNYFSKVLNQSLFDVDIQQDALAGISQDENYNLSVFLSTVRGSEELLRKNYATLRVFPAKSYLGDEVSVDAMAISSDTGCLVAAGLYLWSGDIGQYSIESNVANFKTKYEKPGFRNVFLVEKATQGILGYDSYVCSAYNAVINTEESKYVVGDSVLATINVFPVLPEEFVEIQWEVQGHGQLSANSKSIEFQFDKAGTFSILATIKYFGKNFATVKKEIVVNN